jgi:hypothetical protein
MMVTAISNKIPVYSENHTVRAITKYYKNSEFYGLTVMTHTVKHKL